MKPPFQGLPEIKEGILSLWEVFYWDGPIAGICLYQGEMHLYHLRREFNVDSLSTIGRAYWLTRLTNEEKAYFTKREQDVKIFSGTKENLWFVFNGLYASHPTEKYEEFHDRIGWFILPTLLQIPWKEWRHRSCHNKNKK